MSRESKSSIGDYETSLLRAYKETWKAHPTAYEMDVKQQQQQQQQQSACHVTEQEAMEFYKQHTRLLEEPTCPIHRMAQLAFNARSSEGFLAALWLDRPCTEYNVAAMSCRVQRIAFWLLLAARARWFAFGHGPVQLQGVDWDLPGGISCDALDAAMQKAERTSNAPDSVTVLLKTPLISVSKNEETWLRLMDKERPRRWTSTDHWIRTLRRICIFKPDRSSSVGPSFIQVAQRGEAVRPSSFSNLVRHTVRGSWLRRWFLYQFLQLLAACKNQHMYHAVRGWCETRAFVDSSLSPVVDMVIPPEHTKISVSWKDDARGFVNGKADVASLHVACTSQKEARLQMRVVRPTSFVTNWDPDFRWPSCAVQWLPTGFKLEPSRPAFALELKDGGSQEQKMLAQGGQWEDMQLLYEAAVANTPLSFAVAVAWGAFAVRSLLAEALGVSKRGFVSIVIQYCNGEPAPQPKAAPTKKKTKKRERRREEEEEEAVAVDAGFPEFVFAEEAEEEEEEEPRSDGKEWHDGEDNPREDEQVNLDEERAEEETAEEEEEKPHKAQKVRGGDEEEEEDDGAGDTDFSFAFGQRCFREDDAFGRGCGGEDEAETEEQNDARLKEELADIFASGDFLD